MGCCCCGGPSVGGSGFATTVKYAPTGNVMWWVDSGLANNSGVYYDGVYYELSAPSSGGNTILRSLDPMTGAEIARRDLGALFFPEHVLEKNGDLFTYMGGTRIDKIDTSDLSSLWTHSTSTSALTIAVRRLVNDDFVILPYKPAGVDTWQAYQNGTTLIWSLGMTNVGSWFCIDSNGYFVGGGASGGVPRLFRYDSGGSLVDMYTGPAGTTGFHGAALAEDGVSLWARLNTAAADRVVLLDNALGEVFAPVNMSVLSSGPTWIAPLSGAAYFCTNRFVTRVTTGGTVSARHDHVGSGNIAGFDLISDQGVFALKDGTSPCRLTGYDDSSAPATAMWTMNPTVVGQTSQNVIDSRFRLSHDSDGNIYATGARLADTSLDKLP